MWCIDEFLRAGIYLQASVVAFDMLSLMYAHLKVYLYP